MDVLRKTEKEPMDQGPKTKTLLLREDRIRERVAEIARMISDDFSGKEPVFIGILNGAVFFLADLLRKLTIPCSMDFIRASSYGSGTVSSGTILLTKDLEIDISGKPVIIIEDIVDTGLTLKHILKHVEEKGPFSIHVCVLIDKRERREEEVRIDYYGFQLNKGFLVGYGLDCNERFRHLPEIHVLD